MRKFILWLTGGILVLCWLFGLSSVIFELPFSSQTQEIVSLFLGAVCGFSACVFSLFFFFLRKDKRKNQDDFQRLVSLRETLKQKAKKREVHLNVNEPYFCCGNLKFVCQSCGHRGLDSISPSSEKGGNIEFICLNCERCGTIPAFTKPGQKV